MRTDFIRRTPTIAFCLACIGMAVSRPLWAQAPVNVLEFGAVADGVMRKDGAMSPNSPVLTSASGSFTAADQGKYIQVIGAGPGGTSRADGVIAAGSAVLTSGSSGFVSSDVGRCIVVSGAGAGGGNLVGRIQSFSSPSSVTLSVSAQTGVSGVFFNYGGMTLEATIQSVQSSSAVTLSASASALISAATYAYGTDNHAAFQRAVDTVGMSGGGQVSVPAPSVCAAGAVCGYVVKASDQQTAQAPGAVKIRYSNVSLIGDAPQTNLFCRGAFGSYSNTVAFPGTTGNIRGFCLNIGDNGGANGAAGEAVSNVTISQLHLYGMTNGNTFNVNFAYPPTTPTGDGWDVTHKAIYMWDNSAFSNIVINSVIIQDFKAENIYSGGSVVTGMVIENSTMTNFNGNGISMLAAGLQVLNNTISNGSNAAVENSTVSMGSQALVSQLYQGNTISLIPREGIVVVGVDNGVGSGTVKIVNNTFDTIAQMNPSGTESAIYIASQNNYIPPANVTVTGNTCHDCQTFGVFQTSGNTVIQGNNFIVDHYNAGSVFSFTYALNGATISNNTGSSTAQAQASKLNVGAVYVMNPGYANGSFQWKNVIVTGNSWNFPGAPQYQFVTTSGPGWNLVTQDNLRWEGDVCTGCTHADADHGLVNLSATTTIRPYGPVVYVNGNTSPVNATVDASKEEDGSQVQIFNAGTNAVSFSSDNNLSLASAYSLQPGSSLNLVYSAAVGRFTLAGGTVNVSATVGTPQSATVNKTFSTALQATVTNSSNVPMSGVTVTFTAPLSGASATFSGSASAVAVTGANGVATAPALAANGQAGAYVVTASVSGAGTTASYSLTNTAAVVNGNGALAGTGTSSAATVNLTAEGGNDWVHWGDSGLMRKAVVTAQLSAYTPLGSGTVLTYSDDPRPVSWTDGTPLVSAGNDTNGIYIAGTGQGFSFTAPADTTSRTLTVHVGGWFSAGAFTAHLSDGSAADFTDVTAVANGQFDRNYTLIYQAGAAGQSLTVSWVMTAGPAYANVTLNAAALAGPASPAVTITSTAGTPQSATIGTAFAAALQATVRDANNNPVSGATVTFAAPTSGAGGTFGGSVTVAAVTGTTGIATAPTFTANSQAGAYLVVASVANGTSSALFSLTNTAAVTISVSATGGTPQSATVGTAFASPLQATVKDSNNNPVSGATVTFAAPVSGASGTFGGAATVTATTSASGVAIAPAFTANSQAGAYLVVASVANGASSALFSLTNTAAVTISVSATGGTPQNATVGTTFASPLQATVKDSNNNPVSGATVTFAAPVSGASGTFGGSAAVTATTSATGIAIAPAFTANSQTGTYLVGATVANGTSGATFSLTNTAPALLSISATGGTPQSATIGTTFASPLQATVKDANNNPLSGITVTFAAPASGASGTFNGPTTVAATTGTGGVATTAPFYANSQAGSYLVVATIANGSSSALFSLTNTGPVTISVSATGGTPQSANIGATFATPLQATVKDSNNNPVSGAPVTFAAPASGAGGTFSGSATVTAITGATGIATAPAFAANTQAGSYLVVATIANGSSSALFSLTNTGPVTISVTATGGTPQSATVGAIFATSLQATVKDSNNNPANGVTVTFAAPASGAGGTFSGSATVTAITGATGIATAPAFTANSQAGSYSVLATVAGATSGATFSLTNNAASTPTGNGALTGVGTSAFAAVNLTSEGTSDWVHWGDSGLNRKAGVTPQLSSYIPVGTGSVPANNVLAYNNDPRAVNWADGTPTPAAGNDTNGVYIAGVGEGFTFTAPADTTVRTLTVHVGGWLSGGTLTAHLSDSSAADFTDVTAVAAGQYDRNYTLTYQAGSASQTITVSWEMSSGAGNVTISAAALAGTPQSAPSVSGSLTAIADSSSAAANLTAEGVTDWIHWGDGVLNRKSGVTPLLSSYSVIGGGLVNGYSNDPRPVMWTDGSPAAASTNNTDGVYINSLGNGFAFTAAADTTVRTLTIHVGGWFSGGTLTAHLSDGSAADYRDSTPQVSNAFDRNYTVTYNAATPGQTLTISWIDTASGGNVTLNGAALR
jgi:protocatechuate 3,4-dioxygenase beta subunit